jgi:hypothetical protein
MPLIDAIILTAICIGFVGFAVVSVKPTIFAASLRVSIGQVGPCLTNAEHLSARCSVGFDQTISFGPKTSIVCGRPID